MVQIYNLKLTFVFYLKNEITVDNFLFSNVYIIISFRSMITWKLID